MRIARFVALIGVLVATGIGIGFAFGLLRPRGE